MIEYRRLDEICNIIMGQSPDSKSYNYEGLGLPFFQGNADFGDMYPTKRVWCTLPTKVVEPNTLLISVRAPIGALNFSNEPSCIGRGLAGIVPKDSINLKYVYYCLRHKNTELNSKGTGSTFKAISKSALAEIKIKVVSKDRQAEIVTTLDNVTQIIKYRKQQLEQLDLLIKSRFVEMFGDVKTNKLGWVNIKLSKIITNINNGMTRRGNDIDGNIVLRLVELQNGYIDYSSTNRIKLQDDEKQKFLLKENDFLFARVNGNPDYVGRCAVFSDVGEPVYHNDHIIRVHCDDSKLNGTFGCYFFNSEYGKSQIREYITTSAGQYTINQTGISSMHVVLPPLTLQNEFAQFVEQVEKSKTQVQKSLDEAQLLFNSLMQEYFG